MSDETFISSRLFCRCPTQCDVCAVLLVFLFLARDRKPGKRDGLNWMCSTGRQMLRCMLLRRGMLGNRYGTKVKKKKGADSGTGRCGRQTKGRRPQTTAVFFTDGSFCLFLLTIDLRLTEADDLCNIPHLVSKSWETYDKYKRECSVLIAIFKYISEEGPLPSGSSP